MPRGMILAAGRGTRLRPLTDYLPKPLLPVANMPTMAHGLRALHRVGIADACVNVSYRGEQIHRIFGDGDAWGMRLHWFFEEEPHGTAGGMKGVEDCLGDDVIVVIAGDAMLDLDIAPLLDAHRARGAFASLGTVHVDDPSHYGVVVTDAEGRIRRFQEKPAPGTEISRQANTGIYVFDPGIFALIPPGEFYDFALHVFPEILRRGLPFYAAPLAGYWTDVGTPGAYLQANLDYLAGRARTESRGEARDGSLLGEGAEAAGARLTACVVGEGARLPRGCELAECVVWPGTVVREPLVAARAVLTPWGDFRVRGEEAVALSPR